MFNPTRANAETLTATNSEQNDSFTPTVWKPAWIDQNNNSIADSLDQEINDKTANDTAQDYVNVTVMLNTAPTTQDAVDFMSSSGYLTTPPWTEATYGFGGMIPYSAIALFTQQCSNVLLVEKEAVGKATLAYATQQVGARTYVWNTLGLQGDLNASTAIIDTGIDASHADFSPGYGNRDFSKKIVGWTDQVDSTTSPIDDNGHGSHVAGLAAGDGFFSVGASGNATATWGANLESVSSSGTFPISGMMVNRTGAITVKVKWASTGTAKLSSLSLYYGDKTLSTSSWSLKTSVSTPSQNTWYQLTYNVDSTPSGGYDMYHVAAGLTRGTANLYVTYSVSWPYMPPSDGFSAWTGVAPQSKLVGVKTMDSTGSGTTPDLISGINWIITNKLTYHITVASMSIGFDSEISQVDSAVLNLVNSGVTVVVSAGNNESGGNHVYSPASVDEVISVAAMNQFDNVASYSSQGGTSRYTGNTIKPDITAPGGSHYAMPLFSADSNYNDADGWFTDIQANDSAPMQGTSMAAPVISGCAQIVIQAMGGYAKWNWTRNQALQPKMLLLMTATETYPNFREDEGASTSPTLNRGGKDAHEGYGRVNLDAAVDAVLKSYTVGTVVTDTLGMPPTLADISVLGQRLAWARNVQLIAGNKYSFSLNVPAGADYDLYLYDSTGTAYGEPAIVAKSINATTGGTEQFWVTASYTGTYYLVVKRATETTGSGTFTLSSQGAGTVTVTLNTPGLPNATNVVHYIQGGVSKTGNIVANTFSDYADTGTTLTIDNPIYVSATQRYTTADTAAFIVQASGTFTVNYKTQYYIAVNSDHDAPTASQWVDQGSSFTASVTSPTETVTGTQQWVCTGYSLDGGSANSGASYTFLNVQTTHTIMFNWKKQFWIQVNSAHGAPTASAWVNEGEGFTAAVTSPADVTPNNSLWICTGYQVDGGNLAAGTAYTLSNVQAAHTIDFNWKRQFWMQVNSAHGAPTASAWVNEGEGFTASVSSPADVTSNNSQWVCTGYQVDGGNLAAGTAYTFSSVATVHTINFSWKRQFYLTVASAYGSSSGSGWYDVDATVNAVLSAGTISSGNGVQRIFTGWSGDASGTGLTSNDIVMNGAKTATANWKTQYYLTTSTAYGTASGAGWYDLGTTATAVLSVGTVSGGTGVQYVFTGWGDGASGTGLTSNAIVMNEAKTATANWETQYYLNASTPYGTVSGAGWYDSGASASVTVSPSTITETADAQYTFAFWSGDASGTASPSNAITMDGPKTAIANWKTQYHLNISTNFGPVSPSSGWYDAGSKVDISAVAPSTGEEERYVWNDWVGTGAGNYTGTGTSVQVTMNSAVTEVASWTRQYMLTVTSPYGAPTPLTSWFDAGISIAASVDSLVAGTIVTQYSCTGWTGTGSVPASGAATSTQFTIEQPSSIMWNWETQYLLVPLIVIIIVPVAVCASVAAYLLLRRRRKGAV